MFRKIVTVSGVCAIMVAVCLSVAGPRVARAVGSAADAMCNPVVTQCGCGQIMVQGQCQAGSNKYMCPCSDSTNSFSTTGVCVAANKCQANATNGGSLGDIGKLLQGVASIMQALQKQQSSSGSSGSTGTGTVTCTASATNSDGSAATYIGTDANGCPMYSYGASSQIDTTTNAATTNSSLDSLSSALNSSAEGGAGASLSSALGDSTQPNVSDMLNTTPPDTSSIIVATTTPSGTQYVQSVVFGGQDGVSGDIQTAGSGISAFVSSRDSTKNTQVSGFYGEDAVTTITPAQFIYKLCAARPWATNFIAFIVPDTFFDSVCRTHGYTPPTVVKPVYTANKVVKVVATSTPVVPPALTIYTVPASVRSGYRTSVFWNATGVDSCQETSNDGVFAGSTLSGHAASQPLTVTTTFSIVCTVASSTLSEHTTVPVIPSDY